jgi:DNA-directed RNA polymerase sigma subunit (sigma70/sigma32)
MMATPRKPDARMFTLREMTLHECAAELGCTPERVRQIEQKALRKLAEVLAKRGITAKNLMPDPFDCAKA